MLEKFLMISCNKHKSLALGQGERVVFLFSFYTIKGRSRGRSPQALSVPLELDHTVTLRAMLSPRRRRWGHVLLPTLSWAFRAYWGNSKSLGAAFNELRKIFHNSCNVQCAVLYFPTKGDTAKHRSIFLQKHDSKYHLWYFSVLPSIFLFITLEKRCITVSSAIG